MTPPDTRVPPLPAGTRCTLDGREVLAYPTPWSGELWDGRYRCYLAGERTMHSLATREQLQPIEVHRG